MKNMGPASHILGMHIVWDQTKKLLCLSQAKYVTKVLKRLSMAYANLVGWTLPANCKLFGKQSPKTKEENGKMMKISYA